LINDPKGYYKILGVKNSVSMNDIKKAFRQKAHELHPDKNKERDTTREFQFLSEAYAILIDSDTRATYDSQSITTEKSSESKDPIKCSACDKATAQPRYVMFYEVKSFILVTTRNITQGIFCSDCAESKVIKPTIITWLLGWWGFPFGPIYTLQALGINLIGGKKPRKINADILSYQAWYFARQGKFDIANSLANDALSYSTTKIQKKTLNTFKNDILKFNGGKELKKLKAKWKMVSRAFLIQSILILIAAVILLVTIAITSYKAEERRKQTQEKQAREAWIDSEIERVYKINHPIKPLPINGKVFKKIKSKLTPAPFQIITKGREHHFIKMVDSKTKKIVLAVFVRAGEKIKIDLPIGNYKMKYAMGYTWYGEKNRFGKDTIYSQSDKNMIFKIEGNQVLGHTVELFLRANGNLKTKKISSQDF